MTHRRDVDNHTEDSRVHPVSFRRASPGRHGRIRSWLRAVVAIGSVVLVIATLSMGRYATAQQAPVLRCRLETPTVKVNESVTFFIEAVDIANLYGYELTLNFDSDRVAFEDADPGKSGVNLQMGDFLSPDFVVVNRVDVATEKVSLAVTQLNPSKPVTGTGVLAQATLIGVAAGVGNFTFADVVLSNPAGVAIPITLQGCSIEVTAVQVTPLATPTSSATPTPSATATVTGTPPTPASTATATPTATPTATRVPGEGGFVEGIVFEDINANGIREPFEPGVYALVKLFQVGRQTMGFHDAVLSDPDEGTYLFADLPDGRYVVEVTPMQRTEYVYTTLATVDVSIVGASGFSGANFGFLFADSGWWLYLPSVRDEESGAYLWVSSLADS